MPGEAIIAAAADQGRRALTEYESKKLLAAYGAPVTDEVLVYSAAEAAEAYYRLGERRVAVKASGADLIHKTEAGLVELDLRTEMDVREAYERMRAAAPDMDGALVSVMVAGRRELVAGLVRDPQFGPCVMAGLGGVLTEAFADVGFRMAPVDRLEAMDLIDGLACRRMLDPVRGLAAADTDALADVLVALSRVGLDHDQVAEIDVNPLIVKPDGGVVAVDALVLLKGEDHA